MKAAIVEEHRTRDRAALDALYADDYTATDARGDLRTKADLLHALATDPPMAEGRYELGTVRVWGPIAVAPAHGRMVFRNADGTTRVGRRPSRSWSARSGNGAAFAGLGGYVSRWTAGRRPLAHGAAFALVLALGATVSLSATLGTGVTWSLVGALTLMAPAAVAGGVLRRRTMTAARTTLGVRPEADSSTRCVGARGTQCSGALP